MQWIVVFPKQGFARGPYEATNLVQAKWFQGLPKDAQVYPCIEVETHANTRPKVHVPETVNGTRAGWGRFTVKGRAKHPLIKEARKHGVSMSAVAQHLGLYLMDTREKERQPIYDIIHSKRKCTPTFKRQVRAAIKELAVR